MCRMTCSILAAFLLAGPAFCRERGGNSASRLAAAPPVSYRFDQLDDTIRDRIDETARNALSEESKVRMQAEIYSNSTAFLISRLVLPEGEETRLAEREHRTMLGHVAAVETPAAVQAVFDRLIEQIPEKLVPTGATFSLTVVDDDTRDAFTLGGGRIYLGRRFLSQLFVDPERDRHRLAFVLGHELGHVCRGHVRRRYQMQWMLEQANGVIDEHARSRLKANVEKLAVSTAGKGVAFVYSLEEDHQADLFAVHLCRNAGWEGDGCLDPLRERALASLEGDAELPSEIDRKYRVRLQEVLREREGVFADPKYGLHRFVPETGELLRLEPHSIEPGERAIVFVHGMESNPLKFRQLAATLNEDGRILLAYHYPNDGSLARSGIALAKEVSRVSSNAANWDFVCHSAGGLVFRWYAEIEAGSFRRAVMLGTPQHGSALARMRAFLEVAQFLGDLKMGYNDALQEAILDSKGQIGEDLRRESLFLRYLNRPRPEAEPLRERYAIVRGRAMRRRSSLALKGSVKAGNLLLQRTLRQKEMNDQAKDQLLAWLDRLELPEEISRGDLAVTLHSAELEGAARIETLRCNHVELVNDVAAWMILREHLGLAPGRED